MSPSASSAQTAATGSVQARVAIVDYGMGNLHSVKRACEFAGLRADISSDRREIEAADGIVLPGVGAFGDAMANLRRLELVSLLRDAAAANRPMMGICLGIQLLMWESHEFGLHEGLRIFEGDVVRFDQPREGQRVLKVPQIGWNTIQAGAPQWKSGLLEGIADAEYMYFVHSFYIRPEKKEWVVSRTLYGNVDFCSSLARGNLFACQFHPERSGVEGLKVYRNWARLVERQRNGVSKP